MACAITDKGAGCMWNWQHSRITQTYKQKKTCAWQEKIRIAQPQSKLPTPALIFTNLSPLGLNSNKEDIYERQMFSMNVACL
jgi:hypothetical protein